MPAAAYPLTLRTVLRASKSRTQPASFRMPMPRRGSGYAQRVGTLPPVLWSVTFRFTREEAQTFMLWFTLTLERGLLEFTLPIRTEFGTITHTCRFVPDRLMETRESGETFDYRATILAAAQVIPGTAPSTAGLTAAYPLGLRTVLRASKRRRQAAAFSMTNPELAYAYSQASGPDTPVVWDVEFRFTRDEAALFQVWFVSILERGSLPFTMPLRTEFGSLTHELQFLPDSLLDAREEGELWSYRASVSARAQILPST